MNLEQIRMALMKQIYFISQTKQMISSSELDSLGLNSNQIDSSLDYLADKNYIKYIEKTFGESYFQITSSGIDLIEQDLSMTIKKEPIHVTNIVNSTGTIIGNNNAQTISVSGGFKQIYDEIERKNPKNKLELLAEVKTIESELEKETPNKSVISKSINLLKDNAGWIAPAVIEVAKKIFGF
jgi:hypothetical protein